MVVVVVVLKVVVVAVVAASTVGPKRGPSDGASLPVVVELWWLAVSRCDAT